MLSTEEQAVVETVADWVDREVRPVVRDLEHANTYPEKLIEQMKEMGNYGLAIPGPWGEVPVSMPCYALVTATGTPTRSPELRPGSATPAARG